MAVQTCSICLEGLPAQNKASSFDSKELTRYDVAQTRCNHKFHEKCLSKWLGRKITNTSNCFCKSIYEGNYHPCSYCFYFDKEKKTCPLCRRYVYPIRPLFPFVEVEKIGIEDVFPRREIPEVDVDKPYAAEQRVESDEEFYKFLYIALVISLFAGSFLYAMGKYHEKTQCPPLSMIKS
jgi:hypothetical protein